MSFETDFPSLKDKVMMDIGYITEANGDDGYVIRKYDVKAKCLDKKKLKELLLNFNQIPKKFISKIECKKYSRNWNKMIKRMKL